MTLLSSRWTPFFKFVVPAVFVTVSGYVTALMFLEPGRVRMRGGGAPATWDKWVFLGFLILGCFVCARAASLKRVILDDRFLRISSYLRSIEIPLGQIRSGGLEDAWVGLGMSVGVGLVSVGIVERRPLVALVFEKETPFGRVIDFMPRSKESLELLRARLGWKPPDAPADPERSELADELRGRGTV